MPERHLHQWTLVADHIVGGFIVADAHECETCPSRKWSGDWPGALEGGRPPIFATPLPAVSSTGEESSDRG